MESNVKAKKLSAALTFFVVLLMIPGICFVDKVGFCGEGPGEVHPEYRKAVEAYADALIRHGRDIYSKENSPVFVAGGIDLKTQRFVRSELKGQGIREGALALPGKGQDS